MILDYNYDSKSSTFSVSYITPKGTKSFLNFNVQRFKSYRFTPTGPYTDMMGRRCDVKWTEKPHKFDIKNFLAELPTIQRSLLEQKAFPRLYTFDIETYIGPDSPDVADAPSLAQDPITTISICSPDMVTIVLSIKPLEEVQQDWCRKQYTDYLNANPFFHELHCNKAEFRYMYFTSERAMLEWFLTNIVANAAVLSGWNCILYDWQYIVNRIRKHYQDIDLRCCSKTHELQDKKYTDQRENTVILPMPVHTLIVDMMQTIADNDYVVMPIKESLSLDYIAHESVGANKIEYEGTLEDLYHKDWQKYVFYNAIDSVLVQLINYKFKTLDLIYLYSLYCMEKIGKCFSKISLTESLIFKFCFEHNIKIVPEKREEIERGKLLGAYVKKPTPGIHKWMCCNDFASLYPSTIITCNISFENFVGAFHNQQELAKYRDPAKYIVIGPNVFKNAGNIKHPEIGDPIGTFLDETKLAQYRNNPMFFVSVNGSVYRNDRDYMFKQIQLTLKNNRNISKYLSKQLDAEVMLEIEHILDGKPIVHREYHENIIDAMKNIGVEIAVSEDLLKYKDKLSEIKTILAEEIMYYTSNEQAMKLLGNSMYGGSSHIAFYWYNMDLANDITGEARNLIHMMEKHIPEYFDENWASMKDIHKTLGINVDSTKVDALHKEGKHVIELIYGDTDSIDGQSLIQITSNNDESKTITIGELYNRGFKPKMTHKGHELVESTDKVLNYADGKLVYHPVNYIMRHQVSKPKWKLRTKSGQEIIMTSDHSMIVFRNGQKLVVKPNEIKMTDKILITI